MPSRAKRPCAKQGCPKLTTGRYCENHAKEAQTHYNKHHRNKDSNKKYGRNWRKIRLAFLSKNPICELCQADGRLTPANTVHHKRKIADGGNNTYENLQALCNRCHSKLHAMEGGSG